ncbi:Por secretion system C-terminal sorting domain-containing protein [Chitinophaga eiseniae]|uniref:Por secretion system C-terminal sorting domain-containing protein n=1 Tax=Chitinophaga eiseniae TaxID=634771 RepID=A0A1T4TVM9_9BACT|nr:polysaccharide lyase family 8 super-sandwich domain-containing protein [Chitinophaga eiseniae]SKA44496.1 Por secretion system C-terminal sorting domain-containing protein [Chitinophaga eiseniae]
MNKILLLVLMFLASLSELRSQQRFVSFDSGIPLNWQSNIAGALSSSTEHLKGGAGALKWAAQNGDYIRATNLAIPDSEMTKAASAAAQMFVYSQAVTTDTLLFQFLDEDGVVKRQGRMLLNYKGWMEFHRSYYYDYPLSGSVPDTFALTEMKITYKPANASNTCVIYIDEATIIGNTDVRIPGPHVYPDYPYFRKNVTNAPYLDVLEKWKNGPDLPVAAATATELTDLQTVKTRLIKSPGTDTLLTVAKNYVRSLNIHYNSDGSINGKGIRSIFHPDTLVKVSSYCGSLARAAAGDADALSKLLLFTGYLLSEGMAEGGRIVLQTNSYTQARTFPGGFLLALPYYPPAMREEVVKMLKWSNEYAVLYGATFQEGYSVDFLNIKMPLLFELAIVEQDANTAVRDLKLLKRFLERNTVPGLGGRDGMKPDGVGYHHGSQHTSYMGAWLRWIDYAYYLKGTVYKIDLTAYENLSKGLTYLLAGSSKGVLYAHAESGRNPFPDKLPVTPDRFEKFVEIGGDIKGCDADPVMGGIYNDVTGVNKFPVPVNSLKGFHHYNYGALGIQRKNNWVVVMRGLTSKIFGAEIYKTENRYGRYQSYGTLEVLYDGTLAATGYILSGRGWDWNVMPGTTTVHFEGYGGLQPLRTTAMEFQNFNFAGALSLGQEGIFGLNFSEKANGNYSPSRLVFRKTVFAFDSILVCLGSGISAQNGLGDVATNFFQAIHKTTNAPIYVNSAAAVTNASYDETISTATTPLWLLNAQSTGYYIPAGNAAVRVVRTRQATPRESVTNQNLPNSFDTAYASKAWMIHGKNPDKVKYHYVVIPGTTPQGMQTLAAEFATGMPYDILKQTDSLHVVRYNPASLTSYVFFTSNNNVNIGYVKSVSAVSMAGIREKDDTLTVTVNSPDMNITTETAFNYYWLANPRTVSMVLNGNWDVLENPSNVSVTSQGTTLTASFNLEHGFSKTIKLVKHVEKQAEDTVRAMMSTPEAMKAATDKARLLSIFPNPAGSQIEIVFTAANAGTAVRKIMTMQGAVLRSEKMQISKGLNHVSLNVSGLTPGTYMLLLTGGAVQEKGIFVKY